MKPTANWRCRLCKTFIGLYESGFIRPIRPVTIFDATDIIQAFRYMQTGTHKGKILVKMQSAKEISGATLEMPFSLSSESSYLLVGGLGGVGKVISNWMVDHGARHLIYLSRSAGESASDQAFFEELWARGCTATAVAGSVTEVDDVKKALSASSKSLAGVIQMSMVLRVGTSIGKPDS